MEATLNQFIAQITLANNRLKTAKRLTLSNFSASSSEEKNPRKLLS